MRLSRDIMGMPMSIAIVGATEDALHQRAFAYLEEIDCRFSPYRPDSEVSQINAGRIDIARCSAEMTEVLDLAALTKAETSGYFDIARPDGRMDPSGIVKGWAIRNTARLLVDAGATDFFVDAGGDVAAHGRNEYGEEWRAGIRHPFDPVSIVKTLRPRGKGIATSGTYARGKHIYNPIRGNAVESNVVSLTVIGADVLEADRFATAAFAMGPAGIDFIESRPGLEAYQIDAKGIATMTSGFEAFTL